MKNYFNLGKIDLGNLDKIQQFIFNFDQNKDRLNAYPTNFEIHTSLQLQNGNDLVCMKYGTKNMFYTVKGEILKTFFDDWDHIQNQIENKVGSVTNKIPLITFCQNHIFRHIDLKRGCGINVGLLNTEDSITCFWQGKILEEWVNYSVGECILVNVKKEHSVIINDSPSHWKTRSILMWTIEENFYDIINRLRN